MRVIMVEPRKTAYVTEIGDDLRSMQKAVGGLIQAVYPFDELISIVCNEEAKIIGLPPNRALYDENDEVYDIICGAFFVCGLSDDNFDSIPDDLIGKFLEKFHDPEVFMQIGRKIIAIKE